MEIHLDLVAGKVKGAAQVTKQSEKEPQPVKKEAQRGDHSHRSRS